MTTPNHPTPQRSGRTAHEILKQLIEDYKYYGFSNAGMFAKARFQLFNAICSEVIGEDPLYLEDGNLTKMSFEEHDHREKLRAELRQRLKVFFGQDGEKR